MLLQQLLLLLVVVVVVVVGSGGTLVQVPVRFGIVGRPRGRE